MMRFYPKIVSIASPELWRLLFVDLQDRRTVRDQADALFTYVLAAGKEKALDAALILCQNGHMAACSFFINVFLSGKARNVLLIKYGVDPSLPPSFRELAARLDRFATDNEKLFFATLLRLTEHISLKDYRSLALRTRSADRITAGIAPAGGTPLTIMTPRTFTKLINACPGDDFAHIRSLVPLLDYGLKVDWNEWLRVYKKRI
jgi:hypothetical protein